MASNGGGPPSGAGRGPPGGQSGGPTQDQDPPYAPTVQALGETPSVLPDIPINAVFLVLFIAAAAGHMGLFKYNQNKLGKKFVFNAMTFGFCVTRILATSIRIVWSVYPRNISVGIAAQIFVYAGIILLFIANLFFAQRIVRAQHPHVGWSKPFSIALPILIAIIIAMILALIAAVIVQFYVLNGEDEALIIQKVGSTLFAVVAFLPIPIVLASAAMRKKTSIKMTKTIDKFGAGSMRAKIAIVLISATFLTLGAAFRAATTLLSPIPLTVGTPPRPAPEPDYFSKAAFYVFNFTIEIGITVFWLAVRIDKRFYIPDGAHGPGSYAGGFVFAGEAGNEKTRSTRHLVSARSSMRSMHSPYNRSSYATSRTKSLESRISWGGVSLENIVPMFGEDGVEVLPYSALEEQHHAGGDPGDGEGQEWAVEGVDKEMGWDPKSGKWALRPISRRVSMGALSQSSAPGEEGGAVEMTGPLPVESRRQSQLGSFDFEEGEGREPQRDPQGRVDLE